MNFILKKLITVIGIEKVFLMAWNAFYPSLKKKAEESEPDWDDDLLKFVNELIVMFTGAGKAENLKDVKKPEGL